MRNRTQAPRERSQLYRRGTAIKNWLLLLTVILALATIAGSKVIASSKNSEYSGPAFNRILVTSKSANLGIRAGLGCSKKV
jgi:hypothetical protein